MQYDATTSSSRLPSARARPCALPQRTTRQPPALSSPAAGVTRSARWRRFRLRASPACARSAVLLLLVVLLLLARVEAHRRERYAAVITAAIIEVNTAISAPSAHFFARTAAISALPASTWPSSEADSRGVSPAWLNAPTDAPAAASTFIALTWPL
eukprot:scaffold30956_cov61-Phaeocystis_antarctica.AAC.6